MAIKSILIASSGYPTPTDPVCPFVEQIAHAMSRQGVEVTVIAPQSYIKHLLRGAELHPKVKKYDVKGGKPITVYQPYYLTAGNRFKKLNDWLCRRAVLSTANSLRIKPEVCYGHFWHFAYSLYPFARKNNLPLFVATGESRISIQDLHPVNTIHYFIKYIKGVICVSTKNKDESLTNKLTSEEKCIVIPNAIDNSLFRVLDKCSLREQHNIKPEDFIVAFIGWYDKNKGVNRLSDALTKLNDPQIKSLFIGDTRGDINLQPTCPGIIHKGRIDHNQLPEWLNLADVFVLPTLSEGCNNAIIEAMACGLPIISSNLSFNWDVLTDKNSILVDPMNIDQIADAIKKMKDDTSFRDSCSKEALLTAEGLSINERAGKILRFIESKLQHIN